MMARKTSLAFQDRFTTLLSYLLSGKAHSTVETEFRNALTPQGSTKAHKSKKSKESLPALMEALGEDNTPDSLDFNVYLKCFVHELRTPLASIAMGVEVLKTDPSDREEVFSDIANSFTFIDSILTNFSVIQESKIQLNTFEPFSVLQMVKSVQEVLPRNAEYKNVLIDTIVQPGLWEYYRGDAHNLAHVILNLLKNAIKYQDVSTKNLILIQIYAQPTTKPHSPSMPPPSSTSVPRGLSKVRGRTLSHKIPTLHPVCIAVSDSNAHLLPHIKERMFETFNSTSGSGLGLYICKNICDLHGGTIEHAFVRPRGNKFTVTLPLERCDPPVLRQRITPLPLDVGLPTLERLIHVVVVDDNELNCKMAFQLLERCTRIGKIHCCLDGQAALSIVLSPNETVDVVFLDRHMPDMDGLATARALREGGYNRWIVGLTGIDAPEDIQTFLDAGLEHVYAKPLTRAKLDRLVHMIQSEGSMRFSAAKMELG